MMMRTCMLPRELIWEEMAPPHKAVWQNDGLRHSANCKEILRI